MWIIISSVVVSWPHKSEGIMKQVYVVYRWSGDPEADWYPWLKEELKA